MSNISTSLVAIMAEMLEFAILHYENQEIKKVFIFTLRHVSDSFLKREMCICIDWLTQQLLFQQFQKTSATK